MCHAFGVPTRMLSGERVNVCVCGGGGVCVHSIVLTNQAVTVRK